MLNMKKSSFKTGTFSIEHGDQSGTRVSVSSLVNMYAVQNMVLSNLQIGLNRISNVLNIFYELVHHIV